MPAARYARVRCGEGGGEGGEWEGVACALSLGAATEQRRRLCRHGRLVTESGGGCRWGTKMTKVPDPAEDEEDLLFPPGQSPTVHARMSCIDGAAMCRHRPARFRHAFLDAAAPCVQGSPAIHACADAGNGGGGRVV
eukprot:1978514-Rhodomonas_salina.1